MGTSGEERDVVAARSQPAAEVASDSPGSNHRHPHAPILAGPVVESVSLTVVNKGPVSHDVQITDNGDGTLTVRQLSPARVAVLGRTAARWRTSGGC